MKSYYLYTVTGQTTGPHTSDEIRAMLRAKKLPAGTRICQVGEGMWHPLEEVFRPAKPKAPVPPVHPVPPMPAQPMPPVHPVPPMPVQPMPPVHPVPPMPAQPMPPVHPVPPMPAQPMPPVHPVPPMPAQPMPPVHPVPPMPAQPMPPVHPVPPMPVQPVPSTPAAPVQPAPEEEPEPEHKPLPHWNWDAISPKYWSFTGRLDKKSYLTSVSIAGWLLLFPGIGVGVLANFAQIDYLPYVELVDGKYQVDYTPFGFDYFPFLLYLCAFVMYVGGIAALLPPHIRRAHDIGISEKVMLGFYGVWTVGCIVAFLFFDLFGVSTWHTFCLFFVIYAIPYVFIVPLLRFIPGSRKDNCYGPSSLVIPVSKWQRFLYALNIFIKFIPFLEGFKIPHKEDKHACKIETNPASPKVIGLTLLSLMALIGLGSWWAFGVNHGTARELTEAIENNDAAEVERCLDNGAEVNVMYRYDNSSYGDEDFCTPLFLAVQKSCGEDVLRALKAAGAKSSDLKGVSRTEDHANSSLDGPKKYKWESMEIAKDFDSYKTFKKIFKEPKKKKKKRD